MGDDADLPLPELEDGYHFIAALMEVGPVSYAGMDLAPISWPEIAAWQQATRCPFRPHELQLLRSLSAAYLEQYRLSKSDACPSPEIVRPEDGEQAKKLAAHIKSMLRG
ncbi:MAG: hypothetical protein PBV86_01215 [Delftia lacustris]|jgi:hypothetical protein|uniref:hypothetical protein n=1 Tax=Delftia TaxID=80865 RepID=UPI0012A799CA|nr:MULTISPECIES: hypothetical protein [Delftia]QFS67398.1 hypothetical protein GCS91_25380 [Delftia tsuruhatensis]WON89029.1 hypothetical protein OK021_30645 [Delftia sp. UGAL515B_04]